MGLGRTVARYAFSHVGLSVILIAYCVVGALIFRAIELQNYDAALYQQSTGFLSKLTDDNTAMIAKLLREQEVSRNYTYKKSKGDWYAAREKFVDYWTRKLAKHHKNVLKVMTRYTYNTDGTIVDPGDQWSFPSALLFTVSTVTMIGYGHITPKTTLGQIMVVVYALVGVPFMLIFLANIGESMAAGIRSGYRYACCFSCSNIRSKQSTAQNLYDDFEPFYENTGESANVQVSSFCEMRDDDEDKTTESNPVPVSLSVAILVFYILLGGLLYQAWEGWTILDSVYFCFITLSTIGFGDLVPGWKNANTISGQLQLAVSSAYILFGLALLAMGFNLILDSYVEKFKAAASKLGVGGNIETYDE